MSAPTTLEHAATAFADGRCDSAAFCAVFAGAQVFALRPPPPRPPGLVAGGEPGTGHVLAFSSLHQLAQHAGECDWLSITGDDLLALLPDGYGLLLDPSSARPLVLLATALHRGRPTPGPR